MKEGGGILKWKAEDLVRIMDAIRMIWEGIRIIVSIIKEYEEW